MTLSAADFDYLRNLIRSKSGISLSDDKVYLIESRLLPLARSHNFKDISELTAKVKLNNDPALIIELIEAMTTNETSFFRDLKPFQLFENEVLPHLVEKSIDKKIRIWCAAASTGQEPYSLAMTAKEKSITYPGVSFDLQGTDIDKKILKKAEEGIYSQFEIQRGLPINLLMKYFEQQESYGDKWLIKPEIKDMVQYKFLNLLESYSSMGKFDAIFCRNVLIYFERETKSEILNKLAACLKPHGVLFLGSSETITDLSDKYQPFKEHRSIHALK
jgi:chemotaxis protein methyltransferase CheR